MAQYQPLDSRLSNAWPSPTFSEHEKGISHIDPFSDGFSSHPSSPISIAISLGSSEQENPAFNQSSPKATIQCCRCDERQEFLSDWDERDPRYTASCTKCTSAFCRKCVISSTEYVQFDSKFKAFIPAENFGVSFYWVCNNCGLIYDVPVSNIRRKNGVVSIESKGLACEPCSQKATSLNLFVASTPKSSYVSKPFAQQDTMVESTGVIAEDGRYPLFARKSWTNAWSEPRRHWSLRSIKRWTSLSSYGRNGSNS